MIAANEIRVGNWIKYSDSTDITKYYRGKYVKVDIDNFEDIVLDQRYTTIELYTGIPITPEILEKAGFEMHYDKMLWYKSGYKFRIKFYPVGLGYCIQYNDYRSNVFHYVHQFQNVIFALTGEELNIQLESNTPLESK